MNSKFRIFEDDMTQEELEEIKELEQEKEAAITVMKASAGSGKTYQLAYRFIRRILKDPKLFDQILAVTFTNKATCQMKEKILENLEELKSNTEKADYTSKLKIDPDFKSFSSEKISKKAAEAQLEILSDYDRFSVSTIDKFFSKIVRSFFNELKKDPSYDVVISTSDLIDTAITDVIADNNNSEKLQPLFQQRTDSGRNFDIKQDLKTIKDAILKLHGENFNVEGLKKQLEKDKSTVETTKKKIQEKASKMLNDLIWDGGPNITDYSYGKNGFVNNLIKIESEANEWYELKTYFNDVASGKSQPASGKTNWKKEINDKASKIQKDLTEIKGMVDNFKEEVLPIANTVDLIEKSVNMLDIIKVIYDKYCENCKKGNVVAISDMPAMVGDIAASADLYFLYMKIGILLKTIMIDEFQDTSNEQWEGFRPIFEEICSHVEEPGNLIIGDIKQAIYRWRGGDEALLRHKVGEQFKTYERNMDKNYRSRHEVIEFNNKLYEHISEKGVNDIDFTGKDEKIQSEINELIKTTYSNVHQETGNPEKQGGGYVEWMTADKKDLTDNVVTIINNVIKDGYKVSDIAIITRKNGEAAQIASALAKAEIPFVSGESLLLTNSLFVRKMVALIHMAVNPEDRLSIFQYNSLCNLLTLEDRKMISDLANLTVREAVIKLQSKICPPHAEGDYTIFLEDNTPVANFIFEEEKHNQLRIKKMAALLRLAKDVKSDEYLSKYYSLCAAELDASIDESTRQYLTEASAMPLVDALTYIQEKSGLLPIGNESAFCDSFMGIVYSKYKEGMSLSEFISWWDDTGRSSKLTSPEGQKAVNIITIHKSKGLEYPVVIVPYLNWDFTTMTNSLVMFRADEGSEYEKFGILPLSYSASKLYCSRFKNSYLSEIKQSIIDNLNLLYVMTTRAKDRLYLILNEKTEKSKISCFMNSFLGQKGCCGTTKERESKELKEQKTIPVNDISSAKFDRKLVASSSSYLNRKEEPNLNMFKGILMHKALSKIKNLDELPAMVKKLSKIELVPEEEYDSYFASYIEKITKKSEMHEWFDPKWKVYSERGIIIPTEPSGKRPDRVIVDGTTAIVIDYKFGLKESDDYIKQVGQYKSLLKEMGYTDITGYIYYITLDKIISV